MCGRGVSPGVGMEPEQRGRASRASSTSSLGREVRCGCQYYQSDSLLPERRALLVRPSSRTMQQPPAVRCRSVSPIYPNVPSESKPTGKTRWPTLGSFDQSRVVASADCLSISSLSSRSLSYRIGYTVRNRIAYRRSYLRFARVAIDRKLGQLPNPPSPVPRPRPARTGTRAHAAMSPGGEASGHLTGPCYTEQNTFPTNVESNVI